MKQNNLLSNSNGSFIARIAVRVDTEHIEAFVRVFDTKPFRSAEQHSDFTIQLKSARKGDDEAVMYDIDSRLPDLPSFKGWSVLWGESTY